MKYFHLAIILVFFLSCGKNDSSFEIKSLSKYTLTISSNDGGEVSSPGGSYNEGKFCNHYCNTKLKIFI